MNSPDPFSPAVEILNAERMTDGMRRYWNALAARMAGRVQVVDPWRQNLRTLRTARPDLRGKFCYRASTGGTWGKSAQTVKL